MSDLPEKRMTWARRAAEDARHEWTGLRDAVRRWPWRRKVARAIDGWFLGWIADVEPCDDYEARLLAEDDSGAILVPSGRDSTGGPYWQGCWCWWKPTHWPVYVRSRRRRAFVMVESGPR